MSAILSYRGLRIVGARTRTIATQQGGETLEQRFEWWDAVLDVHESQILVVAFPSHWICHRPRLDHGSHMVHDFPRVADQDHRGEIRRPEVVPEAPAALSGTYSGTVHM